ncbi:MAG TPA: DUF5107 domain-containing protein [Verrucomicrobiae bacterium]|nr:DUF5107 domain-containing protein [Verrucomicrobiae bacterium]
MISPTSPRIWAEDVVIPTYLAGAPNRNPMFLEKRVYQGSSGRVYPYPVIDKIHDEKVQEVHRVVFLENQYLKLMVMPGFGGRIQYAYDKTNEYPFIYHNKVIKPALVGLAGPWLSGGIEFNWPQHHRPGTFCPVDYAIRANPDGSMTLWLSEIEPMWHLKGTLALTLYPERALLEITIRLFNPTPLRQSFHLWTNPAVHVNDSYQSVFPPDVQAVYDHGKRDVSSFPIARGQYYKVDYSRGVDISWYKNIPVPTSYMAARSSFDFLGGYDHSRRAGVLHVADHHVIPGKKQWVWGCGDFGKAWDRNLTDSDGPYAELMCGVFADNQPDFSWLEPGEQKGVRQYFLPYKEIGYVRNATTEAAVAFEVENRTAQIGVYATSPQLGSVIRLLHKGKPVWTKTALLSPENPFTARVRLRPGVRREHLEVTVTGPGGAVLVSYRPEKKPTLPAPEPASPILAPAQLAGTEALWLAGQHLEQYRHATREPEDYYREALRRDPADIRNNNSLGLLLMRRGQFAKAEPFFRSAIQTQTRHNPNPPHGEAHYYLGVCLTYLGRWDEAFDAFYKATWNSAWQDAACLNLARISTRRGHFTEALQFVGDALARNARNQKKLHLKTVLLRKLGRLDEARLCADSALEFDPLDFGARNELALLGNPVAREKLLEMMGNNAQSYLAIAADYSQPGAFKEAIELLELCLKRLAVADRQSPTRAPGHVAEVGMPNARPMLLYFLAYYSFLNKEAKRARAFFKSARACSPDRCFPNSLDSIVALEWALTQNPSDGRASFYLGNLWYDKRQVREAAVCWERARRYEPKFPTVRRNLALVYFNKHKKSSKALKSMEEAFALDPTDARVLFELDLLRKRVGISPKKRLALLQEHRGLVEAREDLLIEFITLLNSLGHHRSAFDLLMARKFHPWEGGEGKVTGQYVVSLVERAKELLGISEPSRDPADHPGNPVEAARLAIRLLERARVYPENLGEGKLHGAAENHVLYWLGTAHARAGEQHSAKGYWREATLGMQQPAAAVYYNDQNPETIFYQGLASLKLANSNAAQERFRTLISFGQEHLADRIEIDYFAVSLPEFMVFDDDLNRRNEIHCRYLVALGFTGLGKWSRARAELSKVLKLDPSHQGALLQCRLLQHLASSRPRRRL